MAPLKRNNVLLMLVTATITLVLTAAVYGQKDQQCEWSKPDRQKPQHMKLAEERFEQILDRLAESDPNKAEHLRKLRAEDRRAFMMEISDLAVAGQHFAKKGQRQNQGRMDRQDRRSPRGEHGQPPGAGMYDMMHRGQQRGLWRQLLQEKHEEYVQWLSQNYPQEAEGLEKLRERSPELYMKRIMQSRKRYSKIMEAQKNNPELAGILEEDLQLEEQRNEIVKKIRAADIEQREKLTGELKDVLNRKFDLFVSKKQLQYEDLRKRLEKLQKEVEQLKGQKTEAVEQKLTELTGDTKKLRWD